MIRSILQCRTPGLCAIALALCLACGSQKENLSLANPEWRASVSKEVVFPLAERITLRVGLSQGMKALDTDSSKWLEEQTNIRLEYVQIPSSPGDVVLGEMIREGRLPDILPEGRVGIADEGTRALFVDFLEFPTLTPYFNDLLKSNIDFRNSILAKTTVENKLFALSTYDPDRVIFDGILAYRRDIFEKFNLSTDTWDDIAESLKVLKDEYPEKYPFGGTFDALIYHLPGWFGSGLDPEHLVYYDTEAGTWKFGPAEPEFKTAIEFLVDLVQSRLVSLDLFTAKDEDIARLFLKELIFFAPYGHLSGPSFRYPGENYGALGEDGEWNGEGKWIEAMALPSAPDGTKRPLATGYKNVSGKGWSIYNQAAHVGEAIALIDLLFSPVTAATIALGPAGNAWTEDGGVVLVKEKYHAAYRDGGTQTLDSAISDDGIKTGSTVFGLKFGYREVLGVPELPRYKYFLNHDLGMNKLGVDILLQPGYRVPIHYDFQEDRATAMVSVQTTVESELANFISGKKPLSEYDDFLAQVDKYGARDLVDLYNKWCVVVDPAVLAENLE